MDRCAPVRSLDRYEPYDRFHPPRAYATFQRFHVHFTLPMSLDPDAIEKIAHLARLAIAPERCERYAVDLTNILDLVAQMDAVDTEGVEPMAHPLHMAQRLRPDRPTEPDRRARYQAGAPMVGGGLYLVPKVIE